MTQTLWRAIAWTVTRPRIMQWLVLRSYRTPYTFIRSKDLSEIYMRRWWLFNPYPESIPWLPSVRIHHIMRPDLDRHLHDHPWNARTIILYGGYIEECEDGTMRARTPGDTGRLLYGQYHRIDEILPGGAWTMFITWKYRGTWGFKVDGVKVPWREYLGL